MATIIDELIVTLGLDSRKFKTDADQVQASQKRAGEAAVKQSSQLEEGLRKHQTETNKRLHQTEQVGRQTYQQFHKLRLEVMALFSTLATGYGIQQFIKNITASETGLGNLSRAAGVSVPDLDAVGKASERLGGSADAAKSSVIGFAQALEHSKLTGEPLPFIQYLRKMNIELTDSHHHAKNVIELMKEMEPWFKAHAGPEAQAFGSALGFNQDTINLIYEMSEQMEKVKATGVTMPEDAKAGKDFTETLSDLEHTLTRLGQVLVTKFEPSMAALIKQATELAGQPWIKDEVEAKLREFVTFLEGVGSAVKTVVIAVGGWENATKAVFALWALREVAPILTAIASITTATLGLGSAASGVALTFGGLPALIAGTALALGGAIWDDERIKKYNLEHPDSPIETWFQMFSRMGKGVGNFLGQHFGGATDERQASVRDQLSQRLGISQAAASGIVSNLNAESGIAGINEINPKSGQGGFGWAQWTNTQGSPRRDAFEAYAARMGLSPASDEANMGYLVEELTNKYPQVLAQLRRGDISAREAADIVARGYIVPPSDKIAGHVAGAEGINQLPSPPHYSPIMGDPTPKHPPAYSQGLSNLWGTAPKISFDPALSNLMRTPTAAATTANDNSRKVSNNSETTIGAVHVHTAATDAEGVARGVGAALRKYAYVNQANWGLT